MSLLKKEKKVSQRINEIEEELETKKAKQKRFCQEKKVPYFAPEDGICWSCKKQIFDKLKEETCATEHITGCPYCARSYCD